MSLAIPRMGRRMNGRDLQALLTANAQAFNVPLTEQALSGGRFRDVDFSPTASAPAQPMKAAPVDVSHLRPVELGEQPIYQRQGRDVGAGYISNPFSDEGRRRIGKQFREAPLGGHVRNALEGQELFGHAITNQQGRMAEQVIAGAMAVGIGVPTFLAGVQQLAGDQQTPGTIPMY